MTRKKHPNKDIEAAILYAEENNWRIENVTDILLDKCTGHIMALIIHTIHKKNGAEL